MPEGNKTYKNVGSRTELGIAPGETVTRYLHPDTEARLVARGAIEVVGGNAAQEQPAETTETPAETTTETPDPDAGKSGRGPLGRR